MTAGLLRGTATLISFTEDVNSALSTVDNVHAVTNVTLVHQRNTWGKHLALKLLHKCRDKLLREASEERNGKLQVMNQVILIIKLSIFCPTPKN